jgi:mono/diheme cytochrome c family protein
MRNRIIIGLGVVAVMAIFWLSNEPKVDFNTEVKPLLNKHCMSCHGGVKQSGGFSLLTRQEALAPTESGKPAIIPGKPGASELVHRLKTHDLEARMPKNSDPLDNEQIALLERWVKQGANWGDHWAYVPVQAVNTPTSRTAWGWFSGKKAATWGNNGIDAFVLDRLKAEKLTPSQQAQRDILLRRVCLDLTGLPPTAAWRAQWQTDTLPGAYERLVDTLLSHPAFGERWASVWMDLARYADTKGYERDDRRNAWHYRDWLIRAFNADMPYDQFLTEQIAGDLLDDPNEARLVATQFHRNTPTNDEGGTDNEEFRVAAVIDRVNTTWEAVMGTTFACVQCHSHPYDPFFHDEYYQFSAFFNNTRDADTFEDYPLLRWFKDKDSLEYLTINQWLNTNVNPAEAERVRTQLRLWQPAWYSLETDKHVNSDLLDTKWLGISYNGYARLPNVVLDGKAKLIVRMRTGEKGGAVRFHLDKPDGPLLATLPQTKKSEKGWDLRTFDFAPVSGTHDIYIVYDNPLLAKKTEVFGVTFDWFMFTQPFPGAGKTQYADMEKRWLALLQAPCETSPVMWENPADYRRVTRVFERGNWMVQTKAVEPGTPRYLHPYPADAPRNRLGLARWLTDPRNPLTSRVLINRLWEQLFGTGLVETIEDFGTQGLEPVNQLLLDHMAWRAMHEHKWHIKSILKELVLSATYQQSSEATAAQLAKDPTNRLLARGPRVRLSAEQIRDQALAVSGLLSFKMYGKPVMPYQPEGIWNTPWNDDYWKTSEGEDRHRRAIYTYWKRSSPYPSMITFDGAGRQVCSARRVRTNTPLQALVTLNDTVYVECARFLSKNICKENSVGVKENIKNIYAHITGRPLPAEKLVALEQLYEQALAHYRQKPQEAKELMAIGQKQKADDKKKSANKKMVDAIDKAETAVFEKGTVEEMAALVLVTNAVLNLDEVVVKM